MPAAELCSGSSGATSAITRKTGKKESKKYDALEWSSSVDKQEAPAAPSVAAAKQLCLPWSLPRRGRRTLPNQDDPPRFLGDDVTRSRPAA